MYLIIAFYTQREKEKEFMPLFNRGQFFSTFSVLKLVFFSLLKKKLKNDKKSISCTLFDEKQQQQQKYLFLKMAAVRVPVTEFSIKFWRLFLSWFARRWCRRGIYFASKTYLYAFFTRFSQRHVFVFISHTSSIP